MTYLLDVNVLIALFDPVHPDHQTALGWFRAEGHSAWATCPLTENAVVHIMGQSAYPDGSGSWSIALEILEDWRTKPGHEFWPDDISLTDGRFFHKASIGPSKRITDSYLLALAMAHGGKLATLDTRLSAQGVVNGAAALRGIRD